ncbi:MAG: hypothetical protein C4339_03175 [Nitrososphaerota archaeon]
MKRNTLLLILLGIYFLYNITILSIWQGWTSPTPPPIGLLMGPGMFAIAVLVTGVTTWVAARYLPKEVQLTAAAAPGSAAPRKAVALTSREAGIVASFSGVTFAWNALGLIFVIFPPGSWSITGIMPQIVGMATGPVGLIIAHFVGGLLWYDFPWGTFNFMLSSTWLVTVAYYFYRDVAKIYRYPILFAQTFLLHQYDVYSWALWASHFAKLAPVDFVIPATIVFIGPWSLLNAIPIVIIVALLDRFAPGFMRPTWLDRYTTP